MTMTHGVLEPRVQCSNCKDWKPRSDFHKEKAKPLGLQSRCKFCKHLEKNRGNNAPKQGEDNGNQ